MLCYVMLDTRMEPMDARQSVHGMPLMVRALGGVEPKGTHLERRKKLKTSSQERYTSANILPRTTVYDHSAPAALWALWSNTSGQCR